MRYVIRLNEEGYYGTTPWTPELLEHAVKFDSMKKARRAQNRINGLLMKDNVYAEIEPYKP